ncbi:GNAT family N-acetyltransferase [Bosea caraganae]|uniref:GNAT family N-acetyltransferase n=1 Tax=Bosea caraganae TaxID=2763117 RepID=UPI0015F11193|nr:GNAT family N-acetyltransferase [Bosea caraganae]
MSLHLSERHDAEHSPWGALSYRFDIIVAGRRAGTISLRVGTTHLLTHLAGQIGFSVDPTFRGRGLARKAVLALLPAARLHGLRELWLTTTEDNLASRRTLENLGCSFAGRVPVPQNYVSYAQGEREKLRFRLALDGGD